MNVGIFTGADVIVRKAWQFIARHLVGREKRRGSLARHEWLSLARDHIGAWERVPFLTRMDTSLAQSQRFAKLTEDA